MKLPLRERLTTPLLDRRDAGLKRQTRVHSAANDALNLANNDYLDLASDSRVKAAAIRAIEQYGCSASASPLITGYGSIHDELLKALKEWYAFESGIVWNSGYVANQALLGALPKKGDLVLADRLIHNSMVSGILASGARLARYRHCDVEHLEELLEKHATGDRIVFVVTESVFSMDGDYPDLEKMAKLRDRFGFFWVVDEAHAVGWYGKTGSGLVEHFGVEDSVDALVGTLGKALGSMGAYTLFRDSVVEEFLQNFAGEFIYSTYLAPAAAGAAIESIARVREMESERAEFGMRSLLFRKRLAEHGFSVSLSDSPVVAIPLGTPDAAVEAAKALESEGIYVGAVRPPTVPEGTSRLRISLKGRFSKEKLVEIADRIAEVVKV